MSENGNERFQVEIVSNRDSLLQFGHQTSLLESFMNSRSPSLRRIGSVLQTTDPTRQTSRIELNTKKLKRQQGTTSAK